MVCCYSQLQDPLAMGKLFQREGCPPSPFFSPLLCPSVVSFSVPLSILPFPFLLSSSPLCSISPLPPPLLTSSLFFQRLSCSPGWPCPHPPASPSLQSLVLGLQARAQHCAQPLAFYLHGKFLPTFPSIFPSFPLDTPVPTPLWIKPRGP